MNFKLLKKEKHTKARHGIISTPHGDLETPVFMPVGTTGTVKAMTMRDMKEIGTEIMLGNTYHLYLRPGMDVIKNAGGLHKFIGWDRPLLTDSGGFQVFSLKGLRKVTEEGVLFQSFLDGSEHMFTPEKVMEIENTLGADIIMTFDDCVMPTRIARNGSIYTSGGRIIIRNSIYSNDLSPLDPECDCYTCKNFTKSYLRHLINMGEYTAKQLNTLHNLAFMIKLLATIKTAIKEDRFLEAKDAFFKKYESSKESKDSK